MSVIRTITALFAAILALLSGVFNLNLTKDKAVDMSQFELVWADEFDGDTIDETKWTGCHHSKSQTLVRKGGWWNMDMAAVRDGNLHISTKYFENGYQDNGKAGWYSTALYTKGLFQQKHGYFEVRCILPEGSGMWSAFWLNCDGMNTVGNGGTDGAEIDVFESAFYDTALKNRVSTNIHYDGYFEDIRSENVATPLIIGNDPYKEYNTYGLEWNEDEYIFYINGVETARTTFGGASQVAEYLILSVEVGGEMGTAKDNWAGKALSTDFAPTDFIVDYVRVYQYK